MEGQERREGEGERRGRGEEGEGNERGGRGGEEREGYPLPNENPGYGPVHI